MPMLHSAYWPNAIDAHLEFKSTFAEFIAWSFPLMRAMYQTTHMIGNIPITLRGTQADVECYWYGNHRVAIEVNKVDAIGADVIWIGSGNVMANGASLSIWF